MDMVPPRDYDYGNNEGVPRKERLSRKDEYEMRRNRRKSDKTDNSPPKMMYSGLLKPIPIYRIRSNHTDHYTNYILH
jgi:hypothetical protein